MGVPTVSTLPTPAVPHGHVPRWPQCHTHPTVSPGISSPYPRRCPPCAVPPPPLTNAAIEEAEDAAEGAEDRRTGLIVQPWLHAATRLRGGSGLHPGPGWGVGGGEAVLGAVEAPRGSPAPLPPFAHLAAGPHLGRGIGGGREGPGGTGGSENIGSSGRGSRGANSGATAAAKPTPLLGTQSGELRGVSAWGGLRDTPVYPGLPQSTP